MAAQITHIALANRIFSRYFQKFSKKDFFVGTSFADIRYLRVIDRNQTHTKSVTLADVVLEDNSFRAGLLYHSFVDDVREEYMIQNGIYDIFPLTHRFTQAIKCFEDKFFYPDIESESEIISYYNDILPEEKEFGIADDAINKWHGLLQSYFKQAPTPRTISDFILAIDLPVEMEQEIMLLMEEIGNNEIAINMIKNFHDSYEQIIEKEYANI